MSLQWVVESPWPMKDREYILHRRVARLPIAAAATAATSGGTSGGAGGVGGGNGSMDTGSSTVDLCSMYVRFDSTDDSAYTWQLRPQVPARTQRVVDHRHMQARRHRDLCAHSTRQVAAVE